ncbi:MAG: FtsQ-type POTRA domain-containing protein [Alphaproteobacteria bacterium]|nr:FtsQ-type POTRA domain-containing protein [Alphaproteobacteria bacterium]
MRFLISDSDKRRPRRRRSWPKWLRPAALGLAAAAVLGAGGYGAFEVWRAGTIGAAAERLSRGVLFMTADLGLSVQDVTVTGRSETAAADMLAAIDVQRGTPILSVDPEAVRQRLKRLSWVRDARVERRLPGVIAIAIEERVPMALWQRNGKLVLVDREGAIVLRSGLDRFRHLVTLVGDDAPKGAPELLALLSTEPQLERRVNAAIRVGERRWNLQMDNGIDVRLPENDIAAAWAQLAVLEREQKVLGRDVVTIDLRLPDRFVIRVNPDQTKRKGSPKQT